MITEKLIERAKELSGHSHEYRESILYAERNSDTSLEDIRIAILIALQDEGLLNIPYCIQIENWVADHLLHPEEQEAHSMVQDLFPEEWERGFARQEQK